MRRRRRQSGSGCASVRHRLLGVRKGWRQGRIRQVVLREMRRCDHGYEEGVEEGRPGVDGSTHVIGVDARGAFA